MVIFRTIISIICCVTSSVTALADGEEEYYTLDVLVSGSAPNKGQAILTLFDSKESFLKAPFTSNLMPVDASGRAYFKGIKIPPGIYAVSVFHDEDANGKLNTGLFGIPTELVGFSNNAKGLFGPPSFDKAAFTITKNEVIRIKIGKAKD